MSSIIDSLRRALLTVTSSQECLFMTPPDLYEKTSLRSRSRTGTKGGDMTTESDSQLFYLERETGHVREVILDPMDIEYFAYQTRKPMRSSSMITSKQTKCWTLQKLVSENWFTSKFISKKNNDHDGIGNSGSGSGGGGGNDNDDLENNKELHVLIIPCVTSTNEVILTVMIRSAAHDYDAIDEMIVYWFTKLFSIIIQKKRNDQLFEEFQLTSNELQHESHEKQLQLDRLLLELTERDQQQQQQQQQKDDEQQIPRLENEKLMMSCLLQEQTEILNSLLSSSRYPSESAAALFVNEKRECDYENEKRWNPEEIIGEYCEIVFPDATVEIQTSMESITELNSILLEEKASAGGAGATGGGGGSYHKDSIIFDHLKFIFWQDERRHFIKGLLTYPELSTQQLWLTLKLHPNRTHHSRSTDVNIETPQNLKFKLLNFFQLIILHLQHLVVIKNLQKDLQKIHHEVLQVHHHEMETKIQLLHDMETQSMHEINEIKEEKHRIHEQFHEEIDQIKGKYKFYLEEKRKEKKFLHDFILQLSEVTQFILAQGGGFMNETAATATAITRRRSQRSSSSSSSSKRINFMKIIKKICEGLNAAGVIDLVAASDTTTASPSSQLNTNSFSWISSSSHWAADTSSMSPFAMSSPIAISFDMKKKVLVVSSEEKKKEIITESFSEEWIVVVSSTYPDLTVILPLKTPSVAAAGDTATHPPHHHYVFLAKLHEQHHNTSLSLKLLLNTWSLFHGAFLSLFKVNSLESHLTSHHRQSSLQVCLSHSLHRSNLFHLHMKTKAFSLLKSFWNSSKKKSIEILKEEEKHSLAMKQQIRQLERSLADWAELVKGINGSSDGISNGLPGLWSQACRPLMSMITSHITLLSCGFMVASDDETVLDLNVEELSTYESYISRYDNQDVNLEANIAVRPAAELGSGLQSLAWSILNGQSWRGGGGESNQRLWKLTKGTVNGIEEQMWLVPLRTSSEVLGILRVTVEISMTAAATSSSYRRPSHHEQYGHYVPTEDEEEEGEGKGEEESYPQRSLWKGGNAENAKRNLLNFAELFAPLVTATRLLEIQKTKDHEQFLEIENFHQKEIFFRKEINLLLRKNKLVTESLSVISLAGSEELSDEEIAEGRRGGGEGEGGGDGGGAFVFLGQRLNSQLSLILGMDFFISSSAEGEERAHDDHKNLTRATATTTNVIPMKLISHPIICHDNIEIGYLHIRLPADDFSVIHHQDDDYEPHHDPHHDHDLKLDEEHLLSLLRVLSIPISNLYLTFSKEILLKNKITQAVANLHSLQHEVDDLAHDKEELLHHDLVTSQSSQLYQQLFSLMKEITLSYDGYNNWNHIETALASSPSLASPSPPESKSQTTQQSLPLPLPLSSPWASHRIPKLLIKLCQELQEIFQNQCVFTFAITRKSSQQPQQQQHSNSSTSPGHHLLWYNSSSSPATNESDPKTLLLPNGKTASENTLKLIRNLANSSFESLTRSSVDVDVVDVTQTSSSPSLSSSAVIKVVTYPLHYTSSPSSHHQENKNNDSRETKAFGVLQVCSFSTLPTKDRLLVDKVCGEITEAITNLLAYEMSREDLLLYIHDSLTSNSILKTSIEDISKDCQSWRNRCAIWYEIIQIFSVFFRSEKEFPGNFWEKLKEKTKKSGFVISLKNPKRSELDSQRFSVRRLTLTRDLSYPPHSSQPHTLRDVYLITDLHFVTNDDIEKILEILNLIFETKLTSLEICTLNQEYLAQIDSLKYEMKGMTERCEQLAADLTASSSAMSHQTDKILDLRNQLPHALEESLRPLLGDVISLFRQFSDLSFHQSHTSLSHTATATVTAPAAPVDLTVEQSEQYFTIYARTISASLSRIFTSHPPHPPRPPPNHPHSSSFHVSVLVKSRSSESSSTSSHFTDGIVIFDGVSLVGKMLSDASLLLDPSRGLQSVVHQCFQTNLTQSYSLQGNVYDLHNLDLIGVTTQQLHLLSNPTSSRGATTATATAARTTKINFTTILVIPLPTNIKNLVSVIRVIYSEDGHGSTSTSTPSSPSPFSTSGENETAMNIRVMTEFLSSLGKYFTRNLFENSTVLKMRSDLTEEKSELEQKLQTVQNQFLRYRKLYRVICQEVSPLFDPPATELTSTNLRAPSSHPASLSPHIALHDICLKTLSIVRVLCRSEGQAILIKNQDNTRAISSNGNGNGNFQLLYTGNGIAWPGIEAGTFGSFTLTTSDSSSAPASSLISSVLQAQKSIVVKDITVEKAYNPAIDGRFSPGSSLLLTPLRGRGNVVIGAIIAKKTSNSSTLFSPEDVIATELVATFSSLGLYWGTGLSSIHHKLSQTISKMEELESSVKILKQQQHQQQQQIKRSS